MNVGITFDLYTDYLKEGYDELAAAEFDSEDTIANIETNLQQLGYRTEIIGNVKSLMGALTAGRRWDLVFNICEGLHGFGREALVPALLDCYQIPYTFSDPLALSLALHKGVAKRIVRDLGIATPAFAVVEDESDIARITLPFPLFTKPVAEGSSKGINSSCKVTSRAALRRNCLRLLREFSQPVLVESYLPGREFTVGLVGTGWGAECIGGMEITLKKEAEPNAYSFLNKQEWESLVEYRPIGPDLLRACEALALPAWRGLGCRDAGRIDLRQDEHGKIQVLEINPLAGLNEFRSDLSILCRLCGLSYAELIAKIMQSATKRIWQYKADHRSAMAGDS